MNTFIFDLEGDSLTPTKLHCVSARRIPDGRINSTTDYTKMASLFGQADVLIGHNIIRFDIPVVDRLLGITCKAKLVDTLALSWYLYPERPRHGLAEWGEEFGVPKPKIDDWENLSPEEYIHRCEEDVKINTKLWEKVWKHLLKLYDSEEEAWRLIDYLMFKMDCAREQERSGWLLDVEKCEAGIKELSGEYDEKLDILTGFMPSVPVVQKKTRPAKPYKKDGTRSVTGENWFSLLKEKGFPETYNREIEVVVDFKEPNPASHDQVKAWLFELGWEPQSFDFKNDKSSNYRKVRKIPQVRVEGKAGKELCPSVLALKSKSEGIEALEGITVLAHRLSILKGFMKNVDGEGKVTASVAGLTNTLRFKHSILVNLPGVHRPYGKLVRGCLIAPEGYELCGSDMVGLEDTTKQHYMYEYDPEYVKEMDVPGWDSHLDIGILAGFITEEQSDAHKDGSCKIPEQRHMFKTTNYSCTYGIKAESLARAMGSTVEKAQILIDAYWKRNWSINKIAENCEVKVVQGKKWLFNPVSRLWYSLRYEKDRFSTLNQGTGAYCFDRWVWYMRSKRDQLTGQFHDESICTIKIGNRDKATKLLRWAIEQVNNELKLNKKLDISIQFGENYAQIH